jgi:hypothetical protein
LFQLHVHLNCKKGARSEAPVDAPSAP